MLQPAGGRPPEDDNAQQSGDNDTSDEQQSGDSDEESDEGKKIGDAMVMLLIVHDMRMLSQHWCNCHIQYSLKSHICTLLA